MSELDRAFDLLGLSRDANEANVREAHRFLVKAFHPDRFTSTRERGEADERLKRINHAKDILLQHLREARNAVSSERLRPTTSERSHQSQAAEPRKSSRSETGSTARRKETAGSETHSSRHNKGERKSTTTHTPAPSQPAERPSRLRTAIAMFAVIAIAVGVWATILAIAPPTRRIQRVDRTPAPPRFCNGIVSLENASDPAAGHRLTFSDTFVSVHMLVRRETVTGVVVLTAAVAEAFAAAEEGIGQARLKTWRRSEYQLVYEPAEVRIPVAGTVKSCSLILEYQKDGRTVVRVNGTIDDELVAAVLLGHSPLDLRMRRVPER